MAIQLSPGVNVSEIDLTTVVPSVATSDGAFAGVFRWGPVGERVLIDTEDRLVTRFGKPTNYNPETWFTAANFLSYANRMWISRAANTTGPTPTKTGTAVETSNVVVMGTADLEVGMYITQTSDATVIPAGTNTFILSINSTAVILNQAAGANGSVQLYFGRPESSYSGIGLANASAVVANLVNQTVKNENDYLIKENNFDPDVLYIAKYPGSLGNSLRVGVCDSAESFSSNVALNNIIEYRVGSNTARVKFPGGSSPQAQTLASMFTTGDQLLAGNSSISSQYLQLTSVTTGEWLANVEAIIDGNMVSDTFNYITTDNNKFSNGDIVFYTNAGNSDIIPGLTPNTNYYVVEANATTFKLSDSSYGPAINIAPDANSIMSFAANTYALTMTFQDPYRLRMNYTTSTINRNWEFFNVFETPPGQSEYQRLNGNTAAQDELHFIVVDDDGLFTGVPGSVLDSLKGLSRATDSKNVDGSGNYYKDVINQVCRYVWWANDRPGAASAPARDLATSTNQVAADIMFTLGSDGFNENTVDLATLASAWDLFASPEDIDISLVLQGKPIGGSTFDPATGKVVKNFALANYLIDNIVGGSSMDPNKPNGRRDCIALLTPDRDVIINNFGDEAVDAVSWRNALHSTSYAVMDSGYKYQYDRYNDIYRWIPLNGDIAGTCVRTDATNDAWWSPAGYNRGQIKNVIKLAWNPRKSERDVLYSHGINAVVTQPGEGTVLFGDKTLQAKPSAFDRINVRRLFIVLEKAISTAAKYSLFEFNDEFTRAQFRNLITPYLRGVKGRRGITDFQVVCDETNNTPQVIDANQFIGDIYIKPARSINFIQLNFVAVPTGVQFSQVVGKF
jgi:phage tail sheath protein FI